MGFFQYGKVFLCLTIAPPFFVSVVLSSVLNMGGCWGLRHDNRHHLICAIRDVRRQVQEESAGVHEHGQTRVVRDWL